MRPLLALMALAAAAAAMTAEPNYVNAYTYTNLTVRDAPPGQVSAEGALVDFVVRFGDVLYVGLRPLKPEGNVTLRVGDESMTLPVRDVCRIEVSAVNYTSSLQANVTVRPVGGLSLPILNVTPARCDEARAYLNGTLLQTFRERATLARRYDYSGLYLLLVSTASFYVRYALAARPDLLVANNTFGMVMTLRFSPPPPRPSRLSIGPISALSAGAYAVDTMALGAGTYVAVLQVGPLSFGYNVTVYRSIPSISISVQDHYYGEPSIASVDVTVYGRPYGAWVQVYLDGEPLAQARSPASVPLPLVDAGEHVISVAVAGDGNVTAASSSRRFRVLPLPVKLEAYLNGSSVSPYVVQYGKVLLLSAQPSARLRPAGRLEAYVDGRPADFLLDTLALGVGTHNVTVRFIPSSPNFQQAMLAMSLVVVPSTPSIEVNRTFTVTYGEALRLEFKVTLFGRPINTSAVVQLAGSNYAVRVTRGVGALDLAGLASGAYPGLIVVPATANTERAEATFLVFVGKAPVHLFLSIPTSGVYGNPIALSVKARPAVPGRIAVYVNGSRIAYVQGDSYAGLWSPERGGTYYVSAVFESLDPNYSNVENATFIYVDRARCVLSVRLADVAEEAYVLRRYRLAVDSSASIDYRLYVNGTPVGPSVSFNTTGIYNVTAYFPGDARYYPCSSSALYRAVRNPSVVRISSRSRIAVVGMPVAFEVYIASPVDAVASSARLIKRNLTYNYTEADTYPISSPHAVLSTYFSKPGVYEVRVQYMGNGYVVGNLSNLYVITVEGNVVGLPAFLVWVYLVPAVLGVTAAAVVRKIFRRTL